jgi:hypothetical protein
MAEKNWGNRKGCRYFSSNNPNPGDTELARCMEPELKAFDLQVSGMSGCNEFEARTGVAGGAYETEQAPPMH